MKWFSNGLNETELKKAYRSLAKQHHPDVGGDEEDFKEITSEYATYLAQLSAPAPTQSIEEMQLNIQRVVVKCKAMIEEIYPRTEINWSIQLFDTVLSFPNNTPLLKMVHIMELCRTFLGSATTVRAEFKRDTAKKYRKLLLEDNKVYVECNRDTTPILGWEAIKKGRRWMQFEQKGFSYVYDSKNNIHYYMKKVPKLTLQELMGL